MQYCCLFFRVEDLYQGGQQDYYLVMGAVAGAGPRMIMEWTPQSVRSSVVRTLVIPMVQPEQTVSTSHKSLTSQGSLSLVCMELRLKSHVKSKRILERGRSAFTTVHITTTNTNSRKL